MAYLSLYRKYRSQSFGELAGQDHVTRTLQNALQSGHVAHAYLLCGPRGTGKTSTARLLAKALNCEKGPTPEPCNTCSACTQINGGRFLDMIEIDAASNRGIEQIRDLIDNVAYTPAQGRYKVYIIDEAHQITADAFNAFLKTLEEPPPHVVFIMATTESHKIMATIVSRCQKFDFRRGSLDLLRERVAFVCRAEGAEIEDAALDLIARNANGGWRDALSLLEQVLAFSDGRVTARDVYTVLGTVEADTLHTLADRILAADGAEVFRVLEELICEGKDTRQLLRDLTTHYRNLMLAAAGSPPAGDPAEAEQIQAQARQYGQARLLAAIEALAQADREARWSEQPRLLLELAVVRLMHPREAAAPLQKPAPPARTSPVASAAPPPETRPRVAASDPFVGERAPAPPAARGTPAPPSVRPEPASPGASFGADELPPPPLTVGDARAGGGEDDDFDALFGEAPPETPSFDPPAPPRTAGPRPTPAAPAAAPPPVAPVTPAAAGDGGAAPDLELLRRKWRVVREELARSKKVHIQAYLADTEPSRFERDVLVLRFPSATMAEGFEARGKAFVEPLAAAIQRVTGITCARIRGEVGQPGAPAAKGVARPSEAAPESDAPAPPRPAPPAASAGPARPPAPSAPVGASGSELVHNVLEVFEGRIVDGREIPASE